MLDFPSRSISTEQCLLETACEALTQTLHVLLRPTTFCTSGNSYNSPSEFRNKANASSLTSGGNKGCAGGIGAGAGSGFGNCPRMSRAACAASRGTSSRNLLICAGKSPMRRANSWLSDRNCEIASELERCAWANSACTRKSSCLADCSWWSSPPNSLTLRALSSDCCDTSRNSPPSRDTASLTARISRCISTRNRAHSSWETFKRSISTVCVWRVPLCSSAMRSKRSTRGRKSPRSRMKLSFWSAAADISRLAA
mmetsp:Transcript_121917/g.352073  ORF Transcript_121917/g.352073 Transcript_121917/m.352073 type:complete len:255 (-) Transcript_121917:739-1503(-)